MKRLLLVPVAVFGVWLFPNAAERCPCGRGCYDEPARSLARRAAAEARREMAEWAAARKARSGRGRE